jgi:DNA-binding Lrp family transcriptional regulator
MRSSTFPFANYRSESARLSLAVVMLERTNLHAIDDTDRKILRILQRDGRASMKEIATRIGTLSKVAVSYRVKRLIDSGAIEGFHATINPKTMDQDTLFITSLTIGPKGNQEALIAKKIARLAGIQSVFQTFGDHDIMVIGRARHATAARDIIYKVYEIGGVNDSTTVIAHTVVKQGLDVVV